MSLSLAPLLEAVSPIPSHAVAALAATVFGVWQLIGAKGTARHRFVGWLFVTAMAYAAITAIAISELKLWGRFSPIHILIPITLFTLYTSVRHARAGEVKKHARGMISLVILACLVTGAFTLLPGRVMNEVVFGPSVDVSQ